MDDAVQDRADGSKSSSRSVANPLVQRYPMAATRGTGIFPVFFSTFLATFLALRIVWHVDQAVFLWPVSATAIGVALPFLQGTWGRKTALLAAAAFGFLAGATLSGMPWWVASQLALILCLDIWLGWLLLGTRVLNFDDLKRQSNILRFSVLMVVVPIVDGCLGSFPVSRFLKLPLSEVVILSILSNALGIAVILPAILLLRSQYEQGFRKLLPPYTMKASLAATFFLLVSGLLFWQNKGPFLFMAFPPLVLLLLTTGLEGAVFSSATLSMIGWVATSHGHGPILLMRGTPLEHLLTLQAFVLVCLATALPIGALIDERRRAELNTTRALEEKILSLEENHRLTASLKASNDLFVAFMNNGPFASYIKDADGSMLFYNKFLAEMGGVDEQAWLGLKDEEIWPSEMAAEYRRNDLLVLESRLPAESEDVSPGPNGIRVFWKTLKFPYYDASRDRYFLAGISFDITGDVLSEAALEDSLREKAKLAQQIDASRHLLENFLHHSPTLTYVKDNQGRFVFYNREVEKFFGITSTQWLGRTIAEVRPASEADLYIAQDRQVFETGLQVENIDEVEDQNQRVRKLRSVKFSYEDIDGRIMLAKISQDITDQLKQQEELAAAYRQLEILAMTDALTGLPNRRAFESRAAIEFSVSIRKRRPLSLLVMDIDDFKRRNDTYGHAAGDEALKMLGSVLKGCVRTGDIAARVGGEEFAFLLPETDEEGATHLAARIQEMLRLADHGPAELTVSMGVSTIDKTTPDWYRLLSRADDAMYEAKRMGKNRVIHYRACLLALMKPSEYPSATQ
jgi:diguanylate cyclase (GGDEF)-like protein/PAS domain S-box-containing protein